MLGANCLHHRLLYLPVDDQHMLAERMADCKIAKAVEHLRGKATKAYPQRDSIGDLTDETLQVAEDPEFGPLP